MQKQATTTKNVLNQAEINSRIPQAKEKQRICEQCATPIPTGAELCPGCGTYVEHGHCSFCDFELEEDDLFCPDCGNPRSGITCPHCRTLNYRSFCSHCNAPLNDLAQDALTESSGDLTFVAMQSLAFSLGTIGQTLEKHEQKQPAELDNYNNKLLAQYNELLTSNSPGRPKREASAPRTAAGAGFYQQKVQEMQLLMDSLKPEEGITAQMQRNYYSARKLSEENLRSARHATGWMCNYCRCVHRQPSECVYKELGGKWIFE